MRNILNRCSVFLEGNLIVNNERIYLYSILDYEYNFLKKKILGRVK